MPRYSPRTGLLDTYQVGPFDSTHIYVQWGGVLPGAEQWSCGMRMWKAAGSTDFDAAALLPFVSAEILSYHTRAASSINPLCKLSFVKVNAIAVDGTYISPTTRVEVYPDTPGGGDAVLVPNQVALAVSLTTGFSRGPAHRGRFFNPLPALQVGSDGRLSIAQATAVSGSAETLITNLNGIVSRDEVVVVMSRKAGAPGHRAVTGADVGRVLDTQRRRRRSLVEDYRSA